MTLKEGFLNEYRFHKGFNKFMLKKDRENFIKFNLSFLVAYFGYNLKEKICRAKGHKFIDEGYANPESGKIVMSCSRCGWSTSSILY